MCERFHTCDKKRLCHDSQSKSSTVSQCAELLGAYVGNRWTGRSSDTLKSASKMEGIMTEGKPKKKQTKKNTSTCMNSSLEHCLKLPEEHKQARVRCLAQGHIDWRAVGAGNSSSNPLITECPIVLPEPDCQNYGMALQRESGLFPTTQCALSLKVIPTHNEVNEYKPWHK